MGKEPFEIWAPRAIAGLRQEADTLEKALQLYFKNNVRSNGETASAVTQRSTADTPRAPRTSKYEPVMKAFEIENRALSLDEMIEIARSRGLLLERNNARSLVFSQKKLGRVVPEGDRYLWKQQDAQPESETAPSREEDAA